MDYATLLILFLVDLTLVSMQSSKTEEEMAQVVSNFIFHCRGVRISVSRPQNPHQHLLLVKAYEHAMKHAK